MGREGFEPSTNALKGHCSTAELPTQTKGKRLCVACDGDQLSRAQFPLHIKNFFHDKTQITLLSNLFPNPPDEIRTRKACANGF